MNKQMIPALGVILSLLILVSCGNNSSENDKNLAEPSSAPGQMPMDTVAKQNLAIALRFVNEGLQKGDSTAFNECVDTAVTVYTGLKPSGPIKGLVEYRTIFSAFIKAWPGLSFTVDESFAVNDKVVIRFNSTNIFKNEFFGMKPTNQIASLKEVHIMTFKNGKIINNIVSATNLEYEYILYPLLKDAVLLNVKTEK